jgi:orotate phosphoribosyltransferase
MRVAVVDDTLTTGASALEAARAIGEGGGTVCGVWALIDREQGAQEAIQNAGYPFTALFRASELLEDHGKLMPRRELSSPH